MKIHFRKILNDCLAGRPASLTVEAEGHFYTRLFRPQERLILLGAGHISQSLCRFAVELGFSVTTVDERPEFANKERFPEADGILCSDFCSAIKTLDIQERDYVAILTRGHQYDAECLRMVLSGKMPCYLGMIGSRKRVTEQFRLLEAEGFSRKALEQVHTPIGLEIGALTVPEIAVSILAQMIQCRRRGSAHKSGSSVLLLEDIDLSLLNFLSAKGEKVLLMVYESSGSTPAKSGAMMAADRAGNWAGTIGGGAGEHIAAEAARQLIGTGQSRCLTIDMSHDAAAEEGMACGGAIKVFLTDVEQEPEQHN